MNFKIHYTGKLIKKLNPFPPQDNKVYTARKPIGLWYATNNEWKEFCNELGETNNSFTYKVIIPDDFKLLVIDTLDKLLEFNEKFGFDERGFGMIMIDWEKVSKEYDGIEISPYQYNKVNGLNFSWYYGWDVASGCLWNNNFKVELIEEE